MRRCLLAVLCGALVLGVAACGGKRKPTNGILLIRHPDSSSSQIYLWRPGAGAPVPLGPKGMWIHSAAWSPNGKEIAFVGGPGDAAPEGGPAFYDAIELKPAIYLMRADGSHAREIISDAKRAGVEDPVWSPEGAKILYWGYYGSRLFVFSLRTGRERSLPIEDALSSPFVPAWGSPGIAYASCTGEDCVAETTIKLYDPQTKRSRFFALAPYQITQLAWSRSGQLAVLAFKNFQKIRDWLVVYSSHGRELGRIRAGDGVTCGISWTPDGAHVLVAGRHAVRLYRVSASGLSGGELHKLPFPLGSARNCSPY